jgi:hypothetical protein
MDGVEGVGGVNGVDEPMRAEPAPTTEKGTRAIPESQTLEP